MQSKNPYAGPDGRALGWLVALVAVVALASVGAGSATAAGEGGPRCPAGSSYNKQTKKCETEPTVTCPAGTTYDAGSDICSASPSCEPLFALLFGGVYDSDRNACVGTEEECGFPDPVTFEVVCVFPTMAAQCPTGTTLNPDTDRCEEAAPGPTCPEGFALNEGTGVCEADPIGYGGGGSGTGGGGGGTPGSGGGGGVGGGGGGGKPSTE